MCDSGLSPIFTMERRGDANAKSTQRIGQENLAWCPKSRRSLFPRKLLLKCGTYMDCRALFGQMTHPPFFMFGTRDLHTLLELDPGFIEAVKGRQQVALCVFSVQQEPDTDTWRGRRRAGCDRMQDGGVHSREDQGRAGAACKARREE
jgi:hypothetical protein